MKSKHIIAIAACVALLIGAAAIIKKHEVKEIYINETIPDYSKQMLILNSDIIVEGTVIDIAKSRWSNPEGVDGKRNVLQTDIYFSVSDVLSGNYTDDVVVVRIDKGYDQKSNTRVISNGYPDFTIGEHVVLFLSRDDSDVATDENYFVLTGMRQGKWIIDETTSHSVARNSADSYDADLSESSIASLKQRISEEKANNPNRVLK